MTVHINSVAYSKLILHAAKYPHAAVSGVFLARSEDVKSKNLKIVDAMPLFHNILTLSPMFEAALYQIDSYYHAQNLVVAGYYQANEILISNEKSPIAIKISDKICDVSGHACMVIIQNDKLSQNCGDHALNVYLPSDGKWKETNSFTIEEDAQHKTAALLESKSYRSLVDFDNHFDDIRLDWKNLELTRLLGNEEIPEN